MKSNFWIMLVLVGVLVGQNALNVSRITANPGDTDISVPVCFSNSDIVAGIQFTLHFDTNFVYLDTVIQGERLVGTSIQLSYNNMGDSVKVVIISLSGDSLLPDSGELLTFHFSSTLGVNNGDSTILSLSNVAISSPQATSLPVLFENGVIRFLYQPRAFLILASDTVMAGETARIPLILNNPEDAVSGIQFTLTFNEDILSYDTLLSNLPNTFSYSYNVFPDSVKFVILSFSGDSLPPPSDTIGTLIFSVSNTATPNDSLGITVKNIILSNPQASPIPATGNDGFIGVSTAPPEILYPNGYLNTRTFYTTWRSVIAANLYQIELSNMSNFSVVVDSGSTGDTTWVSSVDFDGKIYARVRSITYRGYRSRWSNVDTFVVDITPPSVPILSSPLNNGLFNNESILFDWSDVIDTTSGVAGYWIEISTDSSFADSYFVSVSETTIALPDTTYYWRVKAVDNAGNEGVWSDIWSFTVDTEIPFVPTLISPIGGVWLTSDTVTFQWSEVTKILVNDGVKSTPVRYVLEVLQGGDVVIHDTVHTNGYTAVLNEGGYNWRVKAFDLAGNESDWSPVDSFGVDITPPGIPELQSPLDRAMLNESNVAFDWSDVIDTTSGVAGYWIEISTDSSFTDSYFVSVSETTIALPDTTYYWRVKAVDNAGNEGVWSDIWSFMVDTQSPETPTLIYPTHGIWLNDPTISFLWHKVIFKTDTKSTPVRYILKVDSSVIDSSISDSLYTTRINGEGIFTWALQAYDLAGNYSDWASDSFGVDTTCPIIDSISIISDTSRYYGPWNVSAWIRDTISGVDNAWLFVNIDNSSLDSSLMVEDTNDIWEGQIPEFPDQRSHEVSYYIKAFDRAQNMSVSDTYSFTVTSVAEENTYKFSILKISSFILGSNKFSIKFSVPSQREISLTIFDVSGRKVWDKKLILGKGIATVSYNLKLGSGVYFIVIKSKNLYEIRRFIVMNR